MFQNSEQEKLTLNLAMKEEPLEESSCNQIIKNDYSDAREESIGVKNETDKGVTEKIIVQRKPPRPSPYGPWVPVEKVPEKPKVSAFLTFP